MSLSQWRTDVEGQLFELVETAIKHPSIDPSKPHRSYIVTNGVLEEEVARTIEDYNDKLARRGGNDHLYTIVRGEMLSMFNKLEEGLWPTELRDIHTLIELYMQPNKATTVDKEKLSSILASTLLLNDTNPQQNNARIARSIASAGLLCAISSAAFARANNYVAEIDVWIIYIAHIFACIERYSLDFKTVSSSVHLGLDNIYELLNQLSDELMTRTHYVEGNPIQDPWVYQLRLTKLSSLMSIYGLWRRNREVFDSNKDNFIQNFVIDNINDICLWGEAAVPQFLAIYWYLRSVDASTSPDLLIRNMIKIVTARNDPREENINTPLFFPYYDEVYVYSHLITIEGERLTDEEIDSDFRGGSYSIEGLVHLYVRLNWKQEMKYLLPDVTRLAFLSFYPDNVWQYYLWRNETGRNYTVLPKHRLEWNDLKEEAMEHEGTDMPLHIKNDYIFSLLFYQTYHHRLRADAIRWLDHHSMDRRGWKW